MTRARALIVYPHLPHYRAGVFSELRKAGQIEYEFAADTVSRDGSIPTLNPAVVGRFYKLKNRWCGRLLWQSGLWRLLRRGRYDAVIFFGNAAYLSTWVGAAACRVSGAKVLFWTIGWHRPERGLRRLARLAFYRLAHQLLLYGQVGREIGAGLGFPRSRMTVIGTSYQADRGNPVRSGPRERDLPQRLLPDAGSEVVTAVVRLNPAKRLDLLIRAAARLKDRGRIVTVLLVGAGPERERLQALATGLGVDLRLPGPVYSYDELLTVYDRTTVTVVPVNAGLTAMQSLAFGRPVITSDDRYHQAPESECIRPGRTGGFYADDSIESLADTIAKWLDRMKTDGDETAAACRAEIAANWSPACHADAISATIHAALRPQPTGNELLRRR